MAGLGDKCAKELANKLVEVYNSGGNGDIDITDLAKEVLADNKRWYVKIGKSALLSELDVINKAAKDAGCAFGKGKAAVHKKEPKSLFKGIFNILGDAFSEGINELKEYSEEASGKLPKTRMTTERDELEIVKGLDSLSPTEIKMILRKDPGILSSGAGGFRGVFDSKFTCYSVTYPYISFLSQKIIRAFTENMKKCKLVPNSLFCAAGSAKIYKKALDEMK